MAIGDLIPHELTHAVLDLVALTCATAATSHGAPVPGSARSVCGPACPDCLLEEAVCEAVVHHAAARRSQAAIQAEAKALDELTDAQATHGTRHADFVAGRALAHIRAQIAQQQARLALTQLAVRSDSGPPGYRDWRAAHTDEAWLAAAVRVVEHRGADPLIARAVLIDSVERILIGDVPARLAATDGSAFARGEWFFAAPG